MPSFEQVGMKTKCNCGNLLVNIYLAQSNGNKKPIGKFCVHCDNIRYPEKWFNELKKEKIQKTEEKKKYQNIAITKIHCPYCNGIRFTKRKIGVTYTKYPTGEHTTGKITYLEQKNNPYIKYSCRNSKCKSETHNGIWTVGLPMPNY